MDEKKSEKDDTDLYAVWTGKNTRETLIDERYFFRRGIPTLVPADVKKFLTPNPDFVFVSEGTAKPLLRQLRDAKDRKTQYAIAEKYTATFAEKIKARKEAHETTRKTMREDAKKDTEAARKAAAIVPHTIVVPGEEELPEGAEDLGPTPPVEEKTPPKKDGAPKGGEKR